MRSVVAPAPDKDVANMSAAERLRSLLAQATNTASSILNAPPPGMTDKEKIAHEIKKRADKKLAEIEAAMEGADALRLGEEGWRERYYEQKFKVRLDNEEFFAQLRKSYLEGLQWVLKYYYQGCASWEWYYPYHYAPFLKEIADVDDLKVSFGPSTPFKPFEQLLAVLPPASAQFVPPAYARLMCDPESPIIDFYPEDFEVDMNGKKFEWQGVVILPFIDEPRLRQAIVGLDATFTPEERARNSFGSELLLVRDDHPLAVCLDKARELGEKTAGSDAPRVPLEGWEIFGSVKVDRDFPGPNDLLPSPLSSLPPLRHRVRCAQYFLPDLPPGHEFRAALRPDVTMPAPVLSRPDLLRQRSFEVGQGGNRLVRNTLGSQSDAQLPANPHRAPLAQGGSWTPYQRPQTHYDAQGGPREPAYGAYLAGERGRGGSSASSYGRGGYSAPPSSYNAPISQGYGGYAPPPPAYAALPTSASYGRGGYGSYASESTSYGRGGHGSYSDRGGYGSYPDRGGRGGYGSDRGGYSSSRGGYSDSGYSSRGGYSSSRGGYGDSSYGGYASSRGAYSGRGEGWRGSGSRGSGRGGRGGGYYRDAPY